MLPNATTDTPPPAGPQPIGPGTDTDTLSILAVIVIYQCLAADSPSLLSLLEAQKAASSSLLRLQILVVDNTPGRTVSGPLPPGVLYRAAPDNPGLARPYNEAARYAADHGFPWLLTLDQDTHLPPGFLTRLAPHARHCAALPQVAAIVPRIADRGRIISPFRYLGGFFPVVSAPAARGLSGRFTSAINSASLLRVSALQEVGGYDLRFPLHNSDTRLYQRLDDAGKRVFLAGDIVVEHELSILDRAGRISPERYRAMLTDECDFWDRHMGVLGRTERILRLAGRVAKGFLQGEDPTYRTIALREMIRRLIIPRRARIRTTDIAWQNRQAAVAVSAATDGNSAF